MLANNIFQRVCSLRLACRIMTLPDLKHVLLIIGKIWYAGWRKALIGTGYYGSLHAADIYISWNGGTV